MKVRPQSEEQLFFVPNGPVTPRVDQRVACDAFGNPKRTRRSSHGNERIVIVQVLPKIEHTIHDHENDPGAGGAAESDKVNIVSKVGQRCDKRILDVRQAVSELNALDDGI